MSPALIPVLIFLPTFLAALLAPCFFKSANWTRRLAVAGLFLSFLASLAGLYATRGGAVFSHAMGGWVPPYGIEWRLDALSAFMALIVSALAGLSLFATQRNVEAEIGGGVTAYYVAALLLISGLFGMILTHDLFNMFVFLEVSSLTAYSLIASGDAYRGNVSSLRYVFIGTIGASFYLLGVGYLYAMTGTLNMSDMAARLVPVMGSRTVFLGFLLILAGFSVKMGLFPFHGWLPDAYTYASNPATALIAPLMTKVSIYALVRILYSLIGAQGMADTGIARVLLLLGAVAVTAGAVMAFFQKSFKRMLAYSSVSHIGLMALGIGLNQKTALVGVFLHLLNHAVMKASLFQVAASVFYRHGIETVAGFEKLRGTMPRTLRATALAALSMIGVPPLAGFFSKWYILAGSVEAGHYGIAAVIVAASLLTALYFFRLIETAFFSGASRSGAENAAPGRMIASEAPASLLYSYSFLSAGLLALGIFSPAIFGWAVQVLAPAVS